MFHAIEMKKNRKMKNLNGIKGACLEMKKEGQEATVSLKGKPLNVLFPEYGKLIFNQ